MTSTVKYGRNDLVRQIDATFTTDEGTEYQVMAFTDTGSVHFGVRTDVSGGWHYGVFRYADAWKDRTGDYGPWDMARFRRMMTDFMAD